RNMVRRCRRARLFGKCRLKRSVFLASGKTTGRDSMKYLNISFCLIAAVLTGTGCGASPNPAARAQKAFAEKVWAPFLQTDRCNNCHDFLNQRANFLPANGPPLDGSACATCHSSAVVGFTNPAWHRAPDIDHWDKNSDPDTIRDHILGFGPGLYTHLVGEGAD